MTGHIRVGGSWKEVKEAHVKVGGVWRKVKEGYTRVNGTWLQWLASDAFFIAYATGSLQSQAFDPNITTDSSANTYVSLNKRDVNRPLFLIFGADGSLNVGRFANNSGNENGIFGWQGSNLVYTDISRGIETLNGTTFAPITRKTSSTALESNRWRMKNSTASNNFVVENTRGSGLVLNGNLDRIVNMWSNQTAHFISDVAISPNGARSGTIGTNTRLTAWSGANLIYQVTPNRTCDRGSVAIDNSGNLYWFQGENGNTNVALFGKLNANGTQAWTRNIVNGITVYRGHGVVIGDDGFIYFLHSKQSGNHINISKWNTSGTLIWQREISGGAIITKARVHQYAEAVYISYSDANDRAVTLRLNTDGNFIGTYPFSGYTVTISAGSMATTNASQSFSSTSGIASQTTNTTVATAGLSLTSYLPTNTTTTI